MNQTETSKRASITSTGFVGHGFAPEGVFAAMLGSVAAYLGVSSLYLPGNYAVFASQISVLMCFAVSVSIYRMFRHLAWGNWLRCLVIFGFITFFYNALASLAFTNVPWRSDGLLYSYDVLFGLELFHTQVAPSLTDVRLITELLSIGYAGFIPYLLVSVLLYGTQRNAASRELFLLSVALLYSIGFLGYLFVPAYGPVVHLTDQFSLPINGGFFHNFVSTVVDRTGGPHGAFPSIPTGGAVLMCLYDFRHGSRTRGWVYLPLVMLIALAAVMLRFHYIIDLVAGTGVAVCALFMAERWVLSRRANNDNEKELLPVRR